MTSRESGASTRASFPKREQPRWGWLRSIVGRWARRPIVSRGSSSVTPAPKATRFWTAGFTCPSAGLKPEFERAPRAVPYSPGNDLSNQAGTRAGAAQAALGKANCLAVTGSPVIAPSAITRRFWNNCPRTSTTWRRSPARAKSGSNRLALSEKFKTEGCTVEQLLKVKHSAQLANPQNIRRRKGPDRGCLCAGAGLLERGPDARKRTLAAAAQRCHSKIKYALSNAPEDIPR